METVLTKTPRQIRIANAIFFFVSGFGYTTWASRIPSIQQQLHLNEAQLGAALFALPIGLMCTIGPHRLIDLFLQRSISGAGVRLWNQR